MNKLPLISLIIPVYGGEKYIYECVDSVLSQTYHNIECILVDGNSPDRCPQICEEYAKKDQRVKVIHKENRGLSDDRNVGFRKSQGEYIAFVDVDDVISVDMIQYLYNLCVKYDVLLAQCNHTVKNAVFDAVTNGQEQGTLIRRERCMNELFGKFGVSFCVSWGKLFHRKVLNTVEFPIGKAHEDIYTTHLYFDVVSSIAFTTKCLYYYRQHKDSLMAQEKKRPEIEELTAGIERGCFFKRRGYKQAYRKQLESIVNRIKMQYCIYNFYWSDAQKSYMRREYRKQFFDLIKMEKCSLSAEYYLFTIIPDIYCLLYRKKQMSNKCTGSNG